MNEYILGIVVMMVCVGGACCFLCQGENPLDQCTCGDTLEVHDTAINPVTKDTPSNTTGVGKNMTIPDIQPLSHYGRVCVEI